MSKVVKRNLNFDLSFFSTFTFNFQIFILIKSVIRVISCNKLWLDVISCHKKLKNEKNLFKFSIENCPLLWWMQSFFFLYYQRLWFRFHFSWLFRLLYCFYSVLFVLRSVTLLSSVRPTSFPCHPLNCFRRWGFFEFFNYSLGNLIQKHSFPFKNVP